MSKPDYDTTLARIAGNVASGLVAPLVDSEPPVERVAMVATAIAEAIVRNCRSKANLERIKDATK